MIRQFQRKEIDMACGVREAIPAHLQVTVNLLCKAERIFSLQKHHASSLHWDLRLQHDGTMPSWAIPKGLPVSPQEGNRLGIQVEDHDLSYADFHGYIPEGQYGAGQVELVDAGPMEILRWDDKYIKVHLHGRFYSGVWSLRNTTGKNWLVRCKELTGDVSG